MFEPEQAQQLLGRIVGYDRVAAEPDAVSELAALCGYLPLALRIAAAKLAARPHWSLADLVARLADERRRLDELTHGGLAVRTSLALSYQGLAPQARLLLRRLGLLAVSEFDGSAAAELLGLAPAEADELLERLVIA